MDFGRRYFIERRFGDGFTDLRPSDAGAGNEICDRQVQTPELELAGRLKRFGVQILRAYQGVGAIELGIPTIDETPLE
jgi:hypothetical protein